MPEVTEESWRQKLPRESSPDERLVVAGLEELSEPEWRDLLSALVSRGRDDPDAVRLFVPDIAFDPLAGAATVIAQLGASASRRFGAAAECLLHTLAKDGEQRSGDSDLRRLLGLIAAVGNGPPTSALEAVAADPAYSPDTRQFVAAVLVDYEPPPRSQFWEELHLLEEPFFLGPYLSAKGKLDPLRGLRLMDDEQISDDAWVQIESASRLCFQRFVDQEGHVGIPKLLNSLSPLGRQRLHSILSLDEFQTIAAELQSSGEVVPFPRTHWDLMCDQVERNRALPLVDFGFDRGEIYEDQPSAPQYAMDFALSLREEIKTSSGRVDIDIRLDWQRNVPLQTRVDEIQEAKIFSTEPQYATPKRLKKVDVIEIGTIDTFAVLGRNETIERLVGDLDIRPKAYMKRPPTQTRRRISQSEVTRSMSELFSYADECDYTIICQPSTAINDELERISTEAPRVFQTFDPKPTTLHALASLPQYLIALDWVTAILVWKAFSDAPSMPAGFEPAQGIQLVLFRYDDTIPVGYFYPKGQANYGQHLVSVIRSALIRSRHWKKEFRMQLERTHVRLHDAKTVGRDLTTVDRKSPSISG